MRTLVPVLGSVAAVVALAVPAGAAAEGVRADLNGDGTPDRVSVENIAGTRDRQLITAEINGIRLTATAPLATHDGAVAPPRAVDVNGDGADEVVVTESIGANTDGFGLWGLYGGLRPVTARDGRAVRLWEGGGVSAVSRYGCEDGASGRVLVTVSAQLTDWTAGVYTGTRTTYAVSGGVVTVVASTPVRGGRNAPALSADPGACARS